MMAPRRHTSGRTAQWSVNFRIYYATCAHILEKGNFWLLFIGNKLGDFSWDFVNSRFDKFGNDLYKEATV